jgi:hypothetical protein
MPYYAAKIMKLATLGRLKVVSPSPAPEVIPMVLKRRGKAALLIAAPLQRSHPEGAVVRGQRI